MEEGNNMDEPQVTSAVKVTEEEADKNKLASVSLDNNESETPMEVDSVALNDEPCTSTVPTVTDVVTENIDALALPEAEEKNDGDLTAADLFDQLQNQSVEQVTFDKPSEMLDVSTDQMDCTERSVNFSQLNIEHNDDSNDAFNALKESEIDALDTPKEEPEEPKESDPMTENQENDQETIDDDVQIEPVEQMETEISESIAEVSEDLPVEPEKESSDNKKPDDEEDDEEDISKDKTVEDEDISEIHDDDGPADEINDGEGIDEDLCLLGDENDESVNVQEGQENVEDSDETQKGIIQEKETTSEEIPAEAVESILDVDAVPLKENEIREITGTLEQQSCLNCENSTICSYKVLEESGDIKYLCTFNCVKEHREDNDDKYTFTQKKIYIEVANEEDKVCSKCEETKLCKYRFSIKVFSTVTKPVETPPADEEVPPTELPEEITESVESTEIKYLCEKECLEAFIGDNTEKYVVKEDQPTVVIEEPPAVEEEEHQEIPKIVARSDAEVERARIDRESSLLKKCAQCLLSPLKSLRWGTLDFCNEKCLDQYQNISNATCVQCNHVVSVPCIGKLCVRFGSDTKQFCSPECLKDFKKSFAPCMLCSKNLKDTEEKVTGITKRGQSFCDEKCAKSYDGIINPLKNRSPYLCSVCNIKKAPEVVAILDGDLHRFCSNPCFSAFKFVNNVVPDQCEMCTKYFERKSNDAHSIFEGDTPKLFCTQDCLTIYIAKNREICKCDWCKVSKYNFDMIRLKDGKTQLCSLNCLSVQEKASKNALAQIQTDCDQCGQGRQPQYQLSMSDASVKHFCTYQCVIGFQSVFSKARATGDMPSVVPAGTAKRITITPARSNFDKRPVPIKSVSTRRGGRKPYNPITNRSGSPIPVPELTVQLERLSDLPSRVKVSSLSGWTPVSRGSSPIRTESKTQVVTIPPLPKQVGNKSTMCKAITLNKGINCVPTTAEAECQTDDWLEQRIIVPVPIVVYVPQPMMMYSLPTPVAVPFVLPVPVPVFVPTTRNSASGIMKEIKKIQEKMPTDPYEAELLMMAEMVAGDKKREVTDSDSDENEEIEYGDGIENNSSFNEDLVQMAFKMAGNDFEDPPVDLENEMTANTISQTSNAYTDDMDPHSLQHHQLLLLQQQRDAAAMQSNRGRKRIQPPIKPVINNARNNTPNKRIKREMEVMQPEMPREPTEKPDANMCLKYTFGVNAWKQWVATKNADFEKSSIRRKPIKSEILQLTADELNYSLCMFVKEVRKPNGSEYAPDTIYYLVLGIQQYLYENGRIDNIFTDRYYEQFTDCLDEVAKKFSVLYNDSQYIVTRVEEEHLWECKQLGAHSPHVLLSTLMFFNTKHFNLVTVDEHMELSFSHIMKHWKRNPNQPGAAKVPGSRNVLLRFYPPQSSLEANSRKKKVYEQQENEENPLRCPVKLYEFYLSKCPESVKTRNDVFYLQPERSCVPDSPVWYSTQPLSRDALSKMLHRVKMVKEINIALLTS